MTSWTETLLEVESYMERYRKALKDIADSSEQANPIKLKEIARTALDGEPTTADEYNTMQEDEKLVFKEQFGGDTGTDADYNYECEHLNATYQAEELDTNVPESYTCDDCNKDLNIPEPDWDIMREGK